MKRKLMMFLTLFFMGIGVITAQTQIRGTVVDNNGEPVIGATIQVKGTSQGTVTDIDGLFTLSVPANSALVISYVGMETQEVTAASNMKIVLVADTQMLQEVVVVGAMGIARPPRSVGFGQTVVNPDEAIQKAEPDLFRSLDGKIPGVQISGSSAVAGSATKVLIRGNSSFLGNNDPLYVVDGVPYSNTEVTTGDRLVTAGAYGTGISTLDPNDIESMDILKGAAAAALYGSRAANGVVLITTKSGSKKQRPSQKKFEVTVTSSYTTEKIASLPEYQNSYGQGSNFLYSNANGSWGPAFGTPGMETIPTWANYLAAYPDMDPTQPYQAYPNNVSGLFRTGGILDNSVNIMSYNDKGNYSATVSRLDQDGYIPHSQFERNSFSVGGNQKLDNGLVIGGTLSYSRSVQDGPFFGAGNYGGSVSSFARTLLMPRNIDAVGLPYETPDGKNLFPFSSTTVDNPLWSWKYNTINTVMDRTVTTMNASYDITDWLSASYQFGWNQYEMDRKQVINIGSVGPEDFEGLGQINNDNYTTQELESNFNMTFKHKFDEDYDLRVTVGHNINQRATYRAEATGNKMIFRGIYNIDNTQEQSASESLTKRRLWAIYADALLGYKDYAFLNLTLRNDHSSTLPVKHQSYFYPAVSGSFVFSDAFQIDTDVLTFGKVRAGWGRVGNDAGPYYVNGVYLQDPPFAGQPIMLLPTTSYDPELKPEFTTEIEAGTELQFFNGRLGLDFTWYNRSTTNQIAPLSLPASTGSRRYYTNFGELNNKGVEIGLTVVPIDLKNSFRWHIFGTFTKNVSNVVSLIEGIEQITLDTGSTSEPQPTLKPGYPYGFLRGSVIARDTDGTPLINPNTGTFMEASELGDLGDPYPDFKTAITNTFSYKGVSLSMMFDARVGGILISGPASDMMGRGVTKDTEDRLGTRILYGILADPDSHEPILDGNGDRILNTIQLSENDLWFSSASTSPTFAMNSVDEFQAFDATVFRLSEITLGYDLPKKLLRNTFIGSVNLSVIARNLWYFAPGFPKYTNYDPGSNAFGSGNVQGIDRESAPTTRRIGFNVKMTF
ncbi:MAG TPA: SusC/RagA family TonB-linked outer membrane protein [Clostridiales bacterium]|jgi:TonB-linked SusC/RagA family outer membrane protein|nr:SusC/RagA family TonB-linked outer membrane protein [Clostridiales bacterium]